MAQIRMKDPTLTPGPDENLPDLPVLPSFVSRLDPLHPPLEKLRWGKLPFERPLAPRNAGRDDHGTNNTRMSSDEGLLQGTPVSFRSLCFFELVHPISETYTDLF